MEKAIPAGGDVRSELIGCWFDQYHGALRRYLRRLVSDDETAADLLQETFVRALRALNPSAPPANSSAWLYRIATNLAYDALRRRRRLRWLPLDIDTPGRAFEGAVAEAEAVRACLARLSAREAEALLLHEVAGLTSGEIAALLSTNPSTVRVRIARASARFRTLYAKETPHEL